MKRILIASAIALTSISQPALSSKLPTLLTDMETKGYFKIIDTTPVNEVKGVTAVMVQDNSQGEFHVYWVDDTQQMIFTGDMVTAGGKNLTSNYRNKLIPSQAETFNQVFEKGLVLGNKPSDRNTDNALFLFYEPFCGYCHKLHKSLKPLIDKGLNVQYIPVAFLRPNSADVIASVAAEKDITKAVYMADARILDTNVKADPELRAKIEYNGFVMRSMGISGTPGIVYRDSNDKVVVARGLSDNKMNEVYQELMSRNKG